MTNRTRLPQGYSGIQDNNVDMFYFKFYLQKPVKKSVLRLQRSQADTVHINPLPNISASF